MHLSVLGIFGCLLLSVLLLFCCFLVSGIWGCFVFECLQVVVFDSICRGLFLSICGVCLFLSICRRFFFWEYLPVFVCLFLSILGIVFVYVSVSPPSPRRIQNTLLNLLMEMTVSART